MNSFSSGAKVGDTRRGRAVARASTPTGTVGSVATNAVRWTIQLCQAVAATYVLVAFIRLLAVPYEGALQRIPGLFGVVLLQVLVFLLPWHRWIHTSAGARRLTWAAAGLSSLALLLSGWYAGFAGWWISPLLMIVWAPALVALELDQPARSSRWGLNRAQWAGWLAWVAVWAGLWWATLNGPGQAAHEAQRMARLTLVSSLALGVAWLMLTARVRARPWATAQRHATWAYTGLLLVYAVCMNTFSPWLVAQSDHATTAPVLWWLWLLLVPVLGLLWLARKRPELDAVVAGIGLIWLHVIPLKVPGDATFSLVTVAVMWVLVAPPRRWWVSVLGWALTLAWYAWVPGVPTVHLQLMALCGTAVGLLIGWQRWALSVAPPADPTRGVPSSTPLVRTEIDPMTAGWATVLGVVVGLLTPVLALSAAESPSMPYMQAMGLLGLLLGFVSYSAALYWAERALVQRHHAEHEQLRQVLHRAKAAYTLFAEDGRFLWANPSIQTISGLSAEQVANRNFRTDAFYLRIGLTQAALQALSTGQTQTLDYQGPGVLSGSLDVSYTIDRVDFAGALHVLLQIQDRTEEHARQAALQAALQARAQALQELEQRQRALEERNAQLDLALEAGHMTFGAYDLQAVASDSPGFFARLGYAEPSTGPARNALLRSVVHPDDWAVSDAMVLAQVDGSAQRLGWDWRVQSAQGEERILRVSNHLQRNAQGRLERIWGVFQDITEHVRREAELVLAKEQAQAAAVAKQQFLSTISHELRTPLNGLLGTLQVLQMEPLSERARKVAGVGAECGKVLMRLICDVLDFSKTQAGRLDLDPQPTPLRQLLEHVHDLLKAVPRNPAVELLVDCPPSLDVKVLVDDIRLRQVLINLGSNALKFTHHGEVRLITECLSRSEWAIQVRFTVRDTGIGMGQSVLDKLFTPFTQGDGSYTRKYGGTGLGLSISQQLIEGMGGHIAVRSQEGQGSTFCSS